MDTMTSDPASGFNEVPYCVPNDAKLTGNDREFLKTHDNFFLETRKNENDFEKLNERPREWK